MSEDVRRTFKMEFERDRSISVQICGEIDEEVLEALEAYIARCRKRLQRIPQDTASAGEPS